MERHTYLRCYAIKHIGFMFKKLYTKACRENPRKVYRYCCFEIPCYAKFRASAHKRKC